MSVEALSDCSSRVIALDAERAARSGQTILEACPYPWFTEEGKLWRKVYRAIVGRTAS